MSRGFNDGRDAIATTVPRSRPPSTESFTLVVGIGASAGGLEACKAFFDHVPADCDMAFVLVQHLSPEHESLLVELLARHTSLHVHEAADGMPVEAGHVYVIPPDSTLAIVDGVLQLTRPAPPRRYRWPIDTFFASLAQDQGENAVSIVLSGSGSDGTRGLVAVKEQGGLTLAQAGFDEEAMSGMPASAAATGLVDDVLPVERMPARLLAHKQTLLASLASKGPDGIRHDLTAHLQTICALLRAQVGHDFSQYKEKTLIRRIQRRMQVVQVGAVHEYIEHLRQHPGELQNLFQELLISVTEFFRDPEAFELVQRHAIPALLAGRGADEALRIWIPACATGEEAYSMAIAFAEAMGQRQAGPRLQIFATDIDERAIAVARAGRYRAPLPNVSAERLERWFVHDGDSYVVSKPIRESIVFSVHSAIKDPPFSRLDLISCRNLLIYLNAELQGQVVRTFHYALRPGGVLLLGPSESLGRNASLFTVLDKKHRLFERRDDGKTALPQVASRTLPRSDTALRPVAATTRSRGPGDAIDAGTRRALEKHMPPHVVVDANFDVLRFSGDTSRYLGLSSGTASLNLLTLLHRGLRSPARTVVQRALSRHATATQDCPLEVSDGTRAMVRLIAEPIIATDKEGATGAGLCLLMFETLPAAAATDGDGDKASAALHGTASEDQRVRELEQELSTTRDQLHTAIDELETANEEMKSANEEYQSVNEELQSSNEELETSKEEMQSINEELQTVNVELNTKNEMLARLNSDLQNLMESTQIPILFLDPALHVSGFTPAIGDLYHLRDSDRGRPITEITARIPYPQLKQDVQQVLRKLSVVERVLADGPDGQIYLLRIRPYRTTDNVIDGVVLTFIDITERQQRDYERGRLAAIVESSQDAIIGHTRQGVVTSWNAGAERMFGHASAQAVGKSLALLMPDAAQDLSRLLAAGEKGAPDTELLMSWVRRDGLHVPVSLRASPVLDPDGQVIGGSVIARDISAARLAAWRIDEGERQLAALIEQATVGVAQFDLDQRIRSANPRFCEIVGRSLDELENILTFQELIHPEESKELTTRLQGLIDGGESFQIEARVVRPDGKAIWINSSVSLVNEPNQPSRVAAVILDITERKLAARHLELLLGELNHRVKNTLAMVQAIAHQTLEHATDPAAFRDEFTSRLRALSKAHDLLARDAWRGVGLRALIEAELAPCDTAGQGTAEIDGKDLHLDPKTAQALSLALHELVTNAVKYGALSTSQGRVRVQWDVQRSDGQPPVLHLRWSEHDGPPVQPPLRRGFGTRLITQGLRHELDCTVSLDFDAVGVACTLDIPLLETGP